MNSVITIQGKTIEEALQKAAQKLHVSREQIEYKVIEKGSRTLFRSRPAIIQAGVRSAFTEHELSIKKQMDKPQPFTPSMNRLGSIWVKDGIIHCMNGLYSYPLLTPCEGAEVRVNGELIKTKTVISEEDVVEVDLQTELVESSITIEISENKMEVYLQTNPGYKLFKQLREMPPAEELTLEIVETKVEQSEILVSDVYSHLRELGIRVGYDPEAIERACRSREPMRCLVAKGIEPIPGKDGSLDLFVQRKEQEIESLKVTDAVDWNDRMTIRSVRAGEVIAVPLPPRQGIHGTNVLGEPVPVTDALPAQIFAGSGTAIYGREQDVVAIESGRLHLEHHQPNTFSISIIPQYIHHGNVNIRSGNLRFHGDMFILGDIEEGMIVESGGHLHVMGTVTNAEIRTNGDAIINGAVLGSTITCGYKSHHIQDMLPSLQAIHKNLVSMNQVIRELHSNQSFSNHDLSKKGFQPLLKLLSEMKFKAIPYHVSAIAKKMQQEKHKMDSEFHKVFTFIEKAFLHNLPVISHLSQLETVTSSLHDVVASVTLESNKKMNVKAQSLTNCKVVGAWDVSIVKFVYGSNISSKGNVEVQGPIRGGRIEAVSSVRANEVGSQGGSQTLITVLNEEGSVRCSTVWPDSVIQVNGYRRKFVDTEYNVYFTGK